MKFYLNYLLLLLLISYLLFLILRLVLERLPITPIFLTGIITLVFFSMKILKYSIKAFIFLYRRSFQKSESGYLKNYLEKTLEKINTFFFEDFFQVFIQSKPFFSILSFTFYKFFINFYKHSREFLLIFFVLPWCFFLFVFLFEIISQNYLYYSLYFLSFNLLLRTVIKLAIFCAEFENDVLAYKTLKNNFPSFSQDAITQSFFIYNLWFKSFVFFNQPKLQEKKYLLFFWKIFGEIFYYHQGSKFLEFLKVDIKHFLDFSTNINLILFISSFFLLFFDLSDIAIVFCLFFSTFISGWQFLVFLKITQKAAPHLLKDSLSLHLFFENWLVLIKKDLVEKHLFLQDCDFQPFIVDKSPKILHKERFLPFKDFFSQEERLFLNTLTNSAFDWFLEQIVAKRVDFKTMAYYPQGFISDAQSHLSDSSTDSKLTKKNK